MDKNRLYHLFLITALLSVLIVGCRPSLKYFSNDPKYKGKYLLAKQKVKGLKKVSEDDVKPYVKQKGNRSILGFYVYLGFYYTGKIAHDTVALKKHYLHTEKRFDEKIKKAKKTKRKEKLAAKKEKKLFKIYRQISEGNWMMRTMGEPPVVFDSSAAIESTKNISGYLKTKGYFQNEVYWNVKYKKRKAKVRYYVTQNEPYRVKSIQYKIDNPRMDSIYQAEIQHTHLKAGVQYDENHLTQERDRVFLLMKNNGYFEFVKQNINYQIDSNFNHHELSITFILSPVNDKQNKVYYIQEAEFYAEVNKGTGMPAKTDVQENGIIKYQLYNKKYNTKILSNKIYLTRDELYKQQTLESIQRRLATLDMFRLVNIKPDVLAAGDSSKLKVGIYTSPLKRFQLTQEYGLQMGQAYIPGPFVNFAFRARNLFRNFEILDMAIRYSIEAQPSALDVDKVLTTQDFNASVGLTFPTLLFPTRLRRKFDRSAPRSKISLAYGYTDRYDYRRDYITTSLSYFFLGKSKHRSYTVVPIEIFILNSVIKTQEFYDYLLDLKNQGNNLYRSFQQSIVTDFHLFYTFNNFEFGANKPSYYFKPYAEVGGLVPSFINQMSNDNSENKILDLQYFEYVKFLVDFRHTRPINKKHALASKIISGFARPFGSSANPDNGGFVLPYEKYFFIGGSSSIRAWPSRRLGPGTYYDSTNGYLFEQPAEILIEASVEYRFKIYSFLEGAFFFDAGNVWTIQDNTRPGSEFKYFSSIPDIAVGTGYGVRFNFTFLIVRFDMGYKLYDPGKPKSNRYVLNETLTQTPTFNLGIGYPF